MASLVFASAASAVCFAVAYVAFMLIAAQAEGAHPPAGVFLRAAFIAAVIAFAVQLTYGGALRRLLQPRRLFTLPVVLLAYLIPITVIGLLLADTTGDLLGIVPWLVFAVVLSTSFWLAARVPA